jgi:N-acetyl-gamma-glutamyl-phosphate reductase
MSRGMLTTLYGVAADSTTAAGIRDCLTSFYAGGPFVRICPENQVPSTLHVRGTNYCDIGCVFDAEHRRVILVSAIDNLVKGAAGQAVQNMNIMLGFDEAAGLDAAPYPL